MNEDLKYPIGKYIAQPFSEKLLGEWLIDIKNLPQHLENAILNLDEAQLNTSYRDGGWTLKQRPALCARRRDRCHQRHQCRRR